MNAYITGSRAYGHKYRKDNSDIDLAVLLDGQADNKLLWDESNPLAGKLMFDKLNIITFLATDADEVIRWHKWRKCHDYLCANPPETKEDAIKVFREADAEKQYFKNKDRQIRELIG